MKRDSITEKELEALQLAAEGLGLKESADRSHRSRTALVLRRRRLFRKLSAINITNAVYIATRKGLIT